MSVNSIDYQKVKAGRLILKGEKKLHKKHKSKKRKLESEISESGNIKDYDKNIHGGWWKISYVSEIAGSVAIQVGETPIYIKALNQGSFTVGAPHDEGDGPDPEEILTAVPASGNKIAFKSGYGKYLSIDSKGNVTGVADAIGPREEWEPVFEGTNTALLAPNDCFIGLDDEDNIIAKSLKAGPEEMITIRSNGVRKFEQATAESEVDKGKLKEVEKSYVKMFQKFQDKKTKINKDSIVELKAAKTKGKLHESLLDRRSKMKADRYCK